MVAGNNVNARDAIRLKFVCGRVATVDGAELIYMGEHDNRRGRVFAQEIDVADAEEADFTCIQKFWCWVERRKTEEPTKPDNPTFTKFSQPDNTKLLEKFREAYPRDENAARRAEEDEDEEEDNGEDDGIEGEEEDHDDNNTSNNVNGNFQFNPNNPFNADVSQDQGGHGGNGGQDAGDGGAGNGDGNDDGGEDQDDDEIPEGQELTPEETIRELRKRLRQEQTKNRVLETEMNNLGGEYDEIRERCNEYGAMFDDIKDRYFEAHTLNEQLNIKFEEMNAQHEDLHQQAQEAVRQKNKVKGHLREFQKALEEKEQEFLQREQEQTGVRQQEVNQLLEMHKDRIRELETNHAVLEGEYDALRNSERNTERALKQAQEENAKLEKTNRELYSRIGRQSVGGQPVAAEPNANTGNGMGELAGHLAKRDDLLMKLVENIGSAVRSQNAMPSEPFLSGGSSAATDKELKAWSSLDLALGNRPYKQKFADLRAIVVKDSPASDVVDDLITDLELGALEEADYRELIQECLENLKEDCDLDLASKFDLARDLYELLVWNLSKKSDLAAVEFVRKFRRAHKRYRKVGGIDYDLDDTEYRPVDENEAEEGKKGKLKEERNFVRHGGKKFLMNAAVASGLRKMEAAVPTKLSSKLHEERNLSKKYKGMDSWTVRDALEVIKEWGKIQRKADKKREAEKPEKEKPKKPIRSVSSFDFDRISKALMGSNAVEKPSPDKRRYQCGGGGHIIDHCRRFRLKNDLTGLKVGKCGTCGGLHPLGRGCPNSIAQEEGFQLKNSNYRCKANWPNPKTEASRENSDKPVEKEKKRGDRPLIKDRNNRNVCFDHLDGRCNRGAKCRFSHDLSQISEESKKKLLAIARQEAEDQEQTDGDASENSETESE
jgi:hypothetical protein